MYAYIRGKLVESGPSEAIVEAHGVGYRLAIPLSDHGKLPQVGEEVLLHTSWVVRENSQTLYGFLEREGRTLFEMLITVSGVGPKTALGLIGHLGPAELQSAVADDRVTTLSKVPGIGKKTAERLIIDLRTKLKGLPLSPSLDSVQRDAVQALVHLGYSAPHAQKAVQKVSGEVEGLGLSALIAAALKV